MSPARDDLATVAIEKDLWPQVEAIYREGIATGHATFETAPPSWQSFDDSRHPDLRLAAVDVDGRVLGWTAAAPVSTRPVYAGVVEHSVYVARAAQIELARSAWGVAHLNSF